MGGFEPRRWCTLYVKNGNLQKLPSPTADPIDARMKDDRLDQRSRCLQCCSIVADTGLCVPKL